MAAIAAASPAVSRCFVSYNQPKPVSQVQVLGYGPVQHTSLSLSKRSRNVISRASVSSASFPPASISDPASNVDDTPELASGGGGFDGNNDSGNHNGGRGGNGGWQSNNGGSSSDSGKGNPFFAMFAKGWSDRVEADPQFVFKVLTEQIIGVTACVLGDMATRPNFGLNELDFVFCTLVVGSIVNFSLMYLLAPTTAAGVAADALPSIFSRCPPAHMFESGTYSILERAGTFVYKGSQFAGVGFLAGLTGTAISTLLLELRKALQPDFILQNKPPPPLLNAATWALHMGFSSNFRYQCLNGLDQLLVPILSPTMFRSLAFFVRGANNIIGGSTFVMLAKITGSQKAAEGSQKAAEESQKAAA